MLRPEQFIRDPALWLSCFGMLGSDIGASPSFGYELVLRRVGADQLEGMDFTGWRTAVVGADRPRPAVMGAFVDLLSPGGLRAEAITPGYGMAEATVAVAGVAAGLKPNVARIRTRDLGMGEPVPCQAPSQLGSVRYGESGNWVMSSGRPHAGVRVHVVDDRCCPVPDGHLGEVVVNGPNLAHGYLGPGRPDGSATADSPFTADGFRSGDAGFIMGGELYILGRIGDSLKIHGTSVYMEDLEAVLCTSCAVRPEKLVCVSGVDGDGPVVAALVEEGSPTVVDGLARQLGELVPGSVSTRVVRAGPGTIQRTTSGKPRRSAMWSALMEQRLPAETMVRQPTGATS